MEQRDGKSRPEPRDDREVAFASNDVRLGPRAWLAAAAIVATSFYGTPKAWERIEPLPEMADYRVPYRLSHDYWTIRRYGCRIAAGDKTVVLGDSVVWGHYVSKDQTLSHYLNELGGAERFVNLGIDGIHPAAMEGLVAHYVNAVADKRVIVHCNLLWMSSPRHDLSTDKEAPFNHPKLVSQFYPRVPCYRESLSRRLGIVVGRYVPLFGWVDHLRIAYFDDLDLAAWTIEHPYANPIGAVTLKLPSPDEPPDPKPVAKPWTVKGIRAFNPPWVALDDSLQWRCFQRTIELLQRRQNEVFVVVGPFNEHMLTDASRRTYRARRRAVATWLNAHRIPHFLPAPLPSDEYADASHPLASGYRRMAEALLADTAFQRFCGRRE